MSAFKVGDVCEIIASENYAHLIGLECVIVGGLQPRMTAKGCEIIAYHIEINGVAEPGPERKWIALQSCLRLKRPPTKDDAEPLLDHVPCEGDWLEDFKRSMKGKVTTHG